MPLFEFRCLECRGEFEALVRHTERITCPRCGETRLERLMSAPSTRVGSGSGLPIASGDCPPRDVPPCGPGCCRLD